MNNKIIIAILVCVLIVLLIVSISLFCMIRSLKTYHYKLEDYKTIGDGENLIKILDSRIEEVQETYVIMNLAYRESLYISMEMQEKITEEIYDKVTDSLPFDYMNTLRIIYDHPLDEIKRRVTLSVMGYVIETNGNYKE